MPWCVKEVYGEEHCFDSKADAYHFWRESSRVFGIKCYRPFWRRH